MKMKTYSNQLVLLIVVTFCLFQCDDKTFPEARYPRISTLPVTNINTTGVTFRATTLQNGTEEIVNRGFVWGDVATVFDQGERVDLGPGGGEFEAVVTRGLVKGSRYFVKAFVATTGTIVYGSPVEFESMGSLGPEIVSFAPMSGSWRDTVTINGANFSGVARYNTVMFGSTVAYVIKSTESMITCLVPDDLGASSSQLSVTVGNHKVTSDNFTLLGPIITSFSPQTATFGDVLTIKGSRLHSYTSQNIVMFDSNPAEVLSASNTELLVKVPSSIRKKESIITVTTKESTGTSAQPFVVSAPVITTLSQTKGKTGESLTITGNNFNAEYGATTVLLDGQPAEISSATQTSLTLTIPNGPFIHRSFPIEVKVAEQSAFSPTPFELQSPWLRTTDIPVQSGIEGGVAFAVDGNGYVGLGYDNGSSFWKFRPTEKDWTPAAAFPGGPRWKSASFVIGNYAYVGLGEGSPSEFWRFNPTTNAWTSITSFPLINSSRQTVGFSAAGKGYVVTSDETDNFWEYNPSTNSWTKKSDYPGVHLPGEYPQTGFVVNDKVYVYSADEGSNPHSAYKYDPESDTWSSIASPNHIGSTSSETGFSVNGKGYIRSDLSMFIYDPVMNSWEIETNSDVSGRRSFSMAIELNGKVYFGGGYYMLDWWEYDPAFD